MPASTTEANAVLTARVRNVFWSVQLYTAAPNKSGGGTAANYGGYSSASSVKPFLASTAANGLITNDTEIVFPACTSGSNVITHFALLSNIDSSVRHYGALSAPITVDGNKQPKITIGAMTLTVD